MKQVGLNVNEENFQDTPDRYAKALIEMLRGEKDTDEQVKALLKVAFSEERNDEMIIVNNIDAVGVCPHHFLPIEYAVTVGYLPSRETFKCVGLSKLPRLVELLAARAIMRETLTVDITSALETYLAPAGAGAIVVGRHGCLSCRGAKQKRAHMVTTSVIGAFRDQPSTKEEFLRNVPQVIR